MKLNVNIKVYDSWSGEPQIKNSQASMAKVPPCKKATVKKTACLCIQMEVNLNPSTTPTPPPPTPAREHMHSKSCI